MGKKFYFCTIEDDSTVPTSYEPTIVITLAKNEERAMKKVWEMFKGTIDVDSMVECYGKFKGKMPEQFSDCKPDYMIFSKKEGVRDWDKKAFKEKRAELKEQERGSIYEDNYVNHKSSGSYNSGSLSYARDPIGTIRSSIDADFINPDFMQDNDFFDPWMY